MSQMFRSFEANSGTIQRKGSEDLAKASTSTVDSANLGQAPKLMAYILPRQSRTIDE
ncbi:MAG: hypothetical protein IH978_03230 [Nitrospinae bacterium]|nr:hypothetical protein [Nitrospinota bacterium]